MILLRQLRIIAGISQPLDKKLQNVITAIRFFVSDSDTRYSIFDYKAQSRPCSFLKVDFWVQLHTITLANENKNTTECFVANNFH